MALTNPDVTALLTEIRDRLQQLDEALAEVPNNVSRLIGELDQLKSDVSIMRHVITDHSYELKAYGERLRDLEQTY